MEGNNNNSVFFSNLAVAFIVLKILGKITWSWVWVVSPLWVPILVGFVCYLVKECSW